MHPPLTISDTPAATFLACVIKFLGSVWSVWSNSAIKSIFYLFEANLHYDCILFEFMIAIWNFEGWSKFAENCQLRTFSSQQLFVDPFVLAQHQTFPFLIRERKKSVSSEMQNITDVNLCYVFGANFCAIHGNRNRNRDNVLSRTKIQWSIQISSIWATNYSGPCQKRVGLLIDQIVWWWALGDKWC